MNRFFSEKEINPKLISPLTLAFIGDTVFDLIVREEIVTTANRPANDLHKLAVSKVKASAQAASVEKLLPVLDETETDVYKRGRNAKSGHLPKNASQGDYHKATGLECLFGYLYLCENQDRIRELYSIIK